MPPELISTHAKFKYDAFISYRRIDGSAIAKRLRRKLIEFRMPEGFDQNKEELKLYVDTLYEHATEDFFELNIKPALAESRVLIIVYTPSTLEPKANGEVNWVIREIDYFRTLPQGTNIWIALGKGSFFDPLPLELHTIFPNIERIDVRSLDSLLFPTVSTDEIVKFIVPLKNVPIEKVPELKRESWRVAQRKRRNLMLIRSSIFTMIALLAIIAFLGWMQSFKSEREAKRQEGIAVAEKDSADKARVYAEDEKRKAESERETAIFERSNAALQKEIAISQKNQAMANYLLSEARAIVATDPTIALRLLEQAMRYHYTDSIKQTALNIYFDNNFYKSVDDSVIPQSRLGFNRLNARFYLDSFNIIYSTDADQKKLEIKLPFKSDYTVNISPDSSHLIAFSKQGEIKVKRVRGKRIEDLKFDSIADFSIETIKPIYDVKLLIEKRIILVTHDYGKVVGVYNFRGKHIHDLRGHEYPIITVFSPDVNTIYTSSKRYYRIEHTPNRKWSIANTIISELEDASAIISSGLGGWNHKMGDYGTTLSPDGKTYLENQWSDRHQSRLVSLFDLQGKRIIDFFDDSELVTAVSFSPDGKYIFTGLSDGRAKMYQADGLYLKTFDFGNEKEISLFSFTPDKKNLLICSKDGKCWSWEMPMPLEAFLKSDKIEPLSAEQKKKYGIQ